MIKRETSAAKRYAADWQILCAIHRRRRCIQENWTGGRILSQFITGPGITRLPPPDGSYASYKRCTSRRGHDYKCSRSRLWNLCRAAYYAVESSEEKSKNLPHSRVLYSICIENAPELLMSSSRECDLSGAAQQ